MTVPPVACDDSAGPLVITPPVDPEDEEPEPEVLASQSAPLLVVAPLVVPVLCVPEPPAGNCDESAGPFVTIPLVAAVPVEPDTAPDPDVLGSQRSLLDGRPAEPAAAAGSKAVPEEPGVGLEQVRRIPLDERFAGPCGAVTSPAELPVSGPTPASIARGSSDSALVSVAVRRRGCALRSRFMSCPPTTQFGPQSGRSVPQLFGARVRATGMGVNERAATQRMDSVSPIFAPLATRPEIR
jgi:hypothetical protein